MHTMQLVHFGTCLSLLLLPPLHWFRWTICGSRTNCMNNRGIGECACMIAVAVQTWESRQPRLVPSITGAYLHPAAFAWPFLSPKEV